jgi:leucyl-tRNA synthetase
MKTNIPLSLSLGNEEIEATIRTHADVLKYLDGKEPKKVIVVKGRIVNIVA